MKTVMIFLLLLSSLTGCANGYERKVDAACSFIYFLPIPVVSLVVGNLGCVLAADSAAVADEAEEEDDEDEDEE